MAQSLLVGRFTHSEFIDHIAIKILNKLSTRFVKHLLYLLAHFFLQLVKSSIYFFRSAASLVDVEYTVFEVDTIHCATKHFITATKYTFEQVVLLVKQLIYTLVGTIGFIDEVDHNYIILLPITMTATYTLFHSLWIPRQIVIY